jgi:hypothetical protein
MEESMKRIALAVASAGFLAAMGGLALAQTSDIRPGADSGAANPPNTGPALVHPQSGAGGSAATTGTSATRGSAVSGSTQPQGTARRHAGSARAEDSPEAQRITRALNALEANGYGSFTNFQPSGNGFTAAVNKGGGQTTVMVDPDTGQVTPQR